jgi:hypothetical protein
LELQFLRLLCLVLLRFASQSLQIALLRQGCLVPWLCAHIILCFFAAGHRNPYWSGCIKVAIVICQQISSILAIVIFLFKIPFKRLLAGR